VPRIPKLLLSTIALVVGLNVLPACARDVLPLVQIDDGIEAVQASVAGHQGLFLFDSGIGTSLITPGLAARIGCKPWGKVTGFRAIGERITMPRCNETTVTLGGMEVVMPQLSVLDLAHLMGPAGAKLSGAIGLDVFAGRVVTLDVAHHQLIIEDKKSLKHLKKAAQEMPIRLARAADGAALTADLGVPTSEGTLWMELDTGDYGPSLVDQDAARLSGLDPANPARQAWKKPLSGDFAIEGTAVVKDLILDGDLGRDVLRHWLVTLDLSSGRGWFRNVE